MPDFARSWSSSKDGKTWTFKTVSGAKWSDGQPLTAADAAWTIDTDIKYKAGGAANAAGLIAHITRAEAPSPTTLVVHYAAAAGNVLGQFQQFAILPQHIWSKYTGHKGNDLKTFANNAPVVGAGPFKLVKFQKDQIALFQRNDSFYGPKPQIDEFGLQMFSNDDALVSALKAHDIDAIEDVPATAIKTLKNAGFTDLRTCPGSTRPTSSSTRTRRSRSTASCSTRASSSPSTMRSTAPRSCRSSSSAPRSPGRRSSPPPTGSWYNPAVKPTTFDLAKANAMLDALGFKRGSGGIRVAERPQDVVHGDHTDRRAERPRTFQIIQADFRKIGVQLIQKALDSSAAFDAITAPNGKYLELRPRDVGLGRAWSIRTSCSRSSTCAQYGGWSDSGFCDKHYDAMYAKQQLTPNQAKRRAIVWQMQSVPAEAEAVPLARDRGLGQRRTRRTGRDSSTRCRGRSTRSRSSASRASTRSSCGRAVRGADYVIKRTAFAVVTVFVAVTINFALFRLAPGTAVSEPLARPPRDPGDCGSR